VLSLLRLFWGGDDFGDGDGHGEAVVDFVDAADDADDPIVSVVACDDGAAGEAVSDVGAVDDVLIADMVGVPYEDVAADGFGGEGGALVFDHTDKGYGGVRGERVEDVDGGELEVAFEGDFDGGPVAEFHVAAVEVGGGGAPIVAAAEVVEGDEGVAAFVHGDDAVGGGEGEEGFAGGGIGGVDAAVGAELLARGRGVGVLEVEGFGFGGPTDDVVVGEVGDAGVEAEGFGNPVFDAVASGHEAAVVGEEGGADDGVLGLGDADGEGLLAAVGEDGYPGYAVDFDHADGWEAAGCDVVEVEGCGAAVGAPDEEDGEERDEGEAGGVDDGVVAVGDGGDVGGGVFVVAVDAEG